MCDLLLYGLNLIFDVYQKPLSLYLQLLAKIVAALQGYYFVEIDKAAGLLME
jgi:hypothetical protein